MTKINFFNKPTLNNIVIAVAEGFDLKKHLNLEEDLKAQLTELLQFKKFTGKMGQVVSFATTVNSTIKYFVIIGAGNSEKFCSLSAIKFGGKIVSHLKGQKIEEAAILMDERLTKENEVDIFANVAYGAILRDYQFNKYKSSDKLKDKISINTIELITEKSKETEKLFLEQIDPVVKAIYFSRDLISEPPNVVFPESFANNALRELQGLNVKVEILDEKQMQDLGMNALLGVGQGSNRESKLLVMHYEGGPKGDSPLAFVGKGVTFDTGGISLKPADRMEDMKYDMSGAAIVTGLIKALAARGAKVNVVAIAGLVENMPDGNAQRPADVVKSMSGQTIEIINTDAEGRLVLSDALWYAQDRFKPKLMVDLATLTGAIIIALGNHYAGIFSNDAELEQKLIAAGKRTDEKLWSFPLGEDYDKMIDSAIADVRNTGNGRGAGSITAAQFLSRFVNNVPWAHIDIAGVSWAEKDADFHAVGATGFGIRLLNEFVKNYEK